MTHEPATERARPGVRVSAAVGVAAGAVATLTFTVVHDLVISDIWSALPAMLVAGMACGASIAWAHGRLAPESSWLGWFGFNTLLLTSFGLLGLASVVVFEPVTSMSAVVASDEPPGELIARALPLTVAFTIVIAAALVLLHGRRWCEFGAALTVTSVLVVFLGLNVSVIGLVEVPASAAYLVAELFGLVAALAVVYALTAAAMAVAVSAITP